jgi:hypothetical protein
MPPRPLTLAILAFWLATTGWLVYSDLWPRWQPGQPPPFVIDLADEARNSHGVWWTLIRNGREECKVVTSIEYMPADDLFELRTRLTDGKRNSSLPVNFRNLSLTVRVNRDGYWRSLSATFRPHLPTAGPETDPLVGVEGTVEAGRLTLRVQSDDLDFDHTFPPVAVQQHGTLLNPLMPLNRLPDVRPGQRWRVPLVVPLGGTFSLSEGPVQFLDAEVQSEPESLEWKQQPVPCHVIAYRGDDVHGHTWVSQVDGLVLKQAITFGQDEWVLKREPQGFKMGPGIAVSDSRPAEPAFWPVEVGLVPGRCRLNPLSRRKTA